MLEIDVISLMNLLYFCFNEEIINCVIHINVWFMHVFQLSKLPWRVIFLKLLRTQVRSEHALWAFIKFFKSLWWHLFGTFVLWFMA